MPDAPVPGALSPKPAAPPCPICCKPVPVEGAAAARVRASGFPDADEHAEVLLGPPGAEEATSVFEGQRLGRE